jgi:lycopene beta-cyclase
VTLNRYDYIIAGGGMAGLSLAFHLERSALRNKKVLIVDRDEKAANDHTWCFWESEASPFEEIVFHRWKTLRFYNDEGNERLLELAPSGIEYKMIRALDFYRFVIPKLEANPAFDLLRADITRVGDGFVETSSGRFDAVEWIFDSVTARTYSDPRDNNLLQHFYGKVIEVDSDVFASGSATLFDFRVPQSGECRFVYVLPGSARRALVEFTVFSRGLLAENEYEESLERYIREVLGVSKYRSVEEERGVIPMSDAPHDTRPSAKVVRIGTAGGYVKPSTGYSFRRTQQRLLSIVKALESGSPVPDFRSVRSRWKMLLDSVFLNVLGTGKHQASDVFDKLFARNPPQRVLEFLDERTGFAADLRLMSSVPLLPFIRAALEEVPGLFRRRRP